MMGLRDDRSPTTKEHTMQDYDWNNFSSMIYWAFHALMHQNWMY